MGMKEEPPPGGGVFVAIEVKKVVVEGGREERLVLKTLGGKRREMRGRLVGMVMVMEFKKNPSNHGIHQSWREGSLWLWVNHWFLLPRGW